MLPANYGMIRDSNGTVLEKAGSKPIEKIKHIKQIKQLKQEPSQRDQLFSLSNRYNDMLLQNDMDDEPINFERDYNASYLHTPADYRAEIERLNQRINDRSMEHNNTINDGKYAGKELEGGIPSYEAVMSMSDEDFAKYERDVLGL